MAYLHTPGPWKVQGGFLQTPSVTAINPGKGHGDVICDAPRYLELSMKDWPANAQLIAAAPDMLDALLTVKDYFFRNGLLSKYANVLDAVEAAIKKATP